MPPIVNSATSSALRNSLRPLFRPAWRAWSKRNSAALLGLLVLGTGSRAEDGPGVQARIGHIEGQGVSQVLPVTPIELLPYYEFDNQLLFSDLRLVITNDGTLGGNMGFGYRFFDPETDRIYGGSFWYDVDDTRRQLFQQVGISLETYATNFDVRGNVYLPVGPESRQDALTLTPGSLGFQNQNLVYTQQRSFYTAMSGFDLEAGIPVPGEIAQSIDLRIYGGGYFYKNEFDDIPGVSGRVRANVLPGLDVELQLTHDSYFETRAYAGISWTFGPLHYSKFDSGDTLGRLGEHVTRNYTVVATHQHQFERVVARNPTTNQAYRFAHVSSLALPGGSGGVENPYNSIAAAQATDPDVIFVHAGSVFGGVDARVVLQSGDRLLGDGPGVQHLFQVPELGTVTLPHGPTGGAFPTLQNSTGDAVVLASGSEFSGFNIVNPAGRGVVGSGLGNAAVRNVSVRGASGHGVELLNTTGKIEFEDLFVSGTTGSGVRISGGTGTTLFSGATQIEDTTAAAVSLNGLAAGSNVTFDQLTIDKRKGRGIEIDGVAAAVTFNGDTRITNPQNSLQSAVDIRNSSGLFTFNHLYATNTRGAAGVNLQDNTGTTMFRTIDVESTGATGLRAYKGGTLQINPAVNGIVDTSKGGTITAVNGTAIDVEQTAIDVNLVAVNSSGASTGLRLVNDTGTFTVWGSGTDGSGGVIQGATYGAFLKDLDSVAFRWMKFDGDGTALRVEDTNLVVLYQTQVLNSTSFGLDAVDLQALNIVNSDFRDNAGQNVRAEFSEVLSYSYTFNNSYFLSATADNVLLSSTGGGAGSSLNLQVQQSEFNNKLVGTSGLQVVWNGALSGSIDRNLFQGSGGNNTGLSVINTGGSLTNLAVTNNQFVMTNGNALGFNLNTAASTQLSMVNNLFEFSGTGNTGFRSTAVSPTFIITSNTVRDSGGGATGLLFDSLTGPGRITLNSNLIDLSTQSILLDRGIIFSNITNTIDLASTQDNAVVGATLDFFAPSGKTTGAIKVNGQNRN